MKTRTKREQADAILAANPILGTKHFADETKRWRALVDKGEALGLRGDALWAWVGDHMDKGTTP